MYDKSTKILLVLAAAFLLLFLSETDHLFADRNTIHTKEEDCFLDQSKEYCAPEYASDARIVRKHTMKKKRLVTCGEEDFAILCRIVQAEAGGEDSLGKQMVADVIINRVNSSRFPNSISGVVFQKSGGKAQFSPVSDGRYDTVQVTDETIRAVQNALEGTDSTNGALYFVNAQKADAGNYAWFESSLRLLAEHGGHRFYQ